MAARMANCGTRLAAVRRIRPAALMRSTAPDVATTIAAASDPRALVLKTSRSGRWCGMHKPQYHVARRQWHKRTEGGRSSSSGSGSGSGSGSRSRSGRSSSSDRWQRRGAVLAGLGIVLQTTALLPAQDDVRGEESDGLLSNLRKRRNTGAEEEEATQAALASDHDHELPEFSPAEIAQHTTIAEGIWVTYKGRVFDVTDWVKQHPGGPDYILAAGGSSLSPFWSLYRQHNTAQVQGILEKFVIGRVSGYDPKEEEALLQQADSPFLLDPQRHADLVVHKQEPFNAETSPHALQSLITPTEHHYVRHHHPVPVVDVESYRLEIDGVGVERPLSLTLEELQTLFPRREVVATLQCGGNRRQALNDVAPVLGLPWGVGAIATAHYAGASVGDVLAAAGFDPQRQQGRPLHVVFEGLDAPHDASVSLDKALDPDTLLVYEMNGEPLPRDHGFPVRGLAPGYLGARSVKWVGRVEVSEEEAQSTWQRGIAYKMLPPSVRGLDNVDASQLPTVNELPVQSAITSVQVSEDGKSVTVKGYAWSGGGRGIVRVDVSGNGGSSWQHASVQGISQPERRAWAWTQWEATVPRDAAAADGSLVCKAVDVAMNQQPEDAASVWNLRGIVNNSWHRVPVQDAKSTRSTTSQ